MKRKSYLRILAATLFVSVSVVFSACSSDDGVSDNTAAGNGKVDVAKGLVFKVNYADYNSTDTVQTRGAAQSETLGTEVVELDNGLMAEVTVKKDTANLKQETVTTRALADDTYTMLAYQGGELKGTLTGTVSSGFFTPTDAGNNPMQLAPGTYDFVLFNSAVVQNGNLLTVSRASGENAFVGRTTYTVAATPSLQEVPFNMQRAMARVKIQLVGYMALKATTTATLSSVNDTDIPGSMVYDASTGVWTMGEGTRFSNDLTFGASGDIMYHSITYISRSDDYIYFLPSTNPSNLKLKFTGGTIYNLNMAGAELKLSVPTLTSMAANGSYVIQVSLKYNFLYLMSDGTTGLFNKTTYGGGDKTPVAVVVSRSNRLAMALKNSGTRSRSSAFIPKLQNYRSYASDNVAASFSDMDGYKYTWDPAGSLDGKTIKAEQQSNYPAFYYAGNYGNELAATGIVVTGDLAGKKWHLPSAGEWKYLFTGLGMADGTSNITLLRSDFNWYGALANLAFTQVGGMLPGGTYWSSTEYNFGSSPEGAAVSISRTTLRWLNVPLGTSQRVRPFIKY